MNRDPLQVAVIGLGVGEQHARAYVKRERCRLRWVLDLDGGRAERLVQELGHGAVAESLSDLVADPLLDVVSVASYDDDHYRQVTALLEVGKHVFVEKPLCGSLDELAHIKKIWLVSENAHLGVNLVLRSAPLYIWLRDLIQSGELGELYAFDGDYLYGRLHKITEGWRKDVPNYSVMQGGGVHLVDLMIWLTGQRPSTVSGFGNRICSAGTAFQHEDYVAATYRFESGLIGRITANFGCVHPHQHVLRMFGTQGTFIYDDRGARLSTSRDPNDPGRSLTLSPLPSTKGDLIPEFVEAILDSKDTSGETQNEFDVMSACIAVDRALEQEASVKVEYV
jgi:predicted dehydrogenase